MLARIHRRVVAGLAMGLAFAVLALLAWQILATGGKNP